MLFLHRVSLHYGQMSSPFCSKVHKPWWEVWTLMVDRLCGNQCCLSRCGLNVHELDAAELKALGGHVPFCLFRYVVEKSFYTKSSVP